MGLAAQNTSNNFTINSSVMSTDYITNSNIVPTYIFNLNRFESEISSPDDLINQTVLFEGNISSSTNSTLTTNLSLKSNLEILSEASPNNNDQYFQYINKNVNEVLLYKLRNQVLQYINYNSNSDIYNENISIPPNEATINLVIDLLPYLIKNNFTPYRFSPSIDEGLCVMFKEKDIIAYLEFYNDGDIGIIAENNCDKNVLINEDISKDQIIESLTKIFT